MTAPAGTASRGTWLAERSQRHGPLAGRRGDRQSHRERRGGHPNPHLPSEDSEPGNDELHELPKLASYAVKLMLTLSRLVLLGSFLCLHQLGVGGDEPSHQIVDRLLLLC